MFNCSNFYRKCRQEGECRATELHVAAVVVAGVERLSAAHREEPQKFPASATNLSERPLPRSFCTISKQKNTFITLKHLEILFYVYS